MTTVLVPAVVPSRFHGHRFARNGRPVDPALISRVSDDFNNALRYRGKEVFRMHGAFPPPTLVTVVRGRFLYRSTPFIRDVAVMFVTMRRNASGTATLTLASGAWSAIVGVDTGGTPAVTDAFDEITTTLRIIKNVPADVDVAGVLSTTIARVLSVAVWEIGPIPDTVNGYLNANYTTNQNILDNDRINALNFSNLMVRRGCAHVFNWCVDNDTAPISTASATFVNIIDGATTVSATTAGYTLDMTNKRRSTESKVRCRFAHYGSVLAGTGGAVHLRDSTGTVIATITGISTTAQWRTVDFDLPATKSKYDITHLTSASTLSTIAVSCFQMAT